MGGSCKSKCKLDKANLFTFGDPLLNFIFIFLHYKHNKFPVNQPGSPCKKRVIPSVFVPTSCLCNVSRV